MQTNLPIKIKKERKIKKMSKEIQKKMVTEKEKKEEQEQETNLFYTYKPAIYLNHALNNYISKVLSEQTEYSFFVKSCIPSNKMKLFVDYIEKKFLGENGYKGISARNTPQKRLYYYCFLSIFDYFHETFSYIMDTQTFHRYKSLLKKYCKSYLTSEEIDEIMAKCFDKKGIYHYTFISQYFSFKNTKFLLEVHNFIVFLTYLTNLVMYSDKKKKNNDNMTNLTLLDDFFSLFDYYYGKSFLLKEIKVPEDLLTTKYPNERPIRKTFKGFCNSILLPLDKNNFNVSENKSMDLKTLLNIYSIGKGFEFDFNMLFSKDSDSNTRFKETEYLQKTYKSIAPITFDPHVDPILMTDDRLFLLPFLTVYPIKTNE